MQHLHERVAFITGGSSGIGLGIARACLDAGMKVAIGYQNDANMNRAMQGLAYAGDRIHAIRVDVTDRRQMDDAAAQTLDRFGKVHLLVNNAGVNVDAPLGEATYEDWDWIMAVNLTGVFNGIRAFLPLLRAHGEDGHIVATASMLGLIANAQLGVYSAAKFGLVGMMEALRAELSGTNIGVSVVCPGYVRSNIWDAERGRAGAGSQLDAGKRDQLLAAVNKISEFGMDPLEIGRLVLDGIRSNDLYILTHPEFEQGIRERCEALLASIPVGSPAPEGRVLVEQGILRNPAYPAERDRRLRK